VSDAVLEMNHVYKKFRRGELYDSLRDLIPALTGGLLKRKSQDQLKEREFWALQDISFQVAHGEALGIIGHNGAGKSTILKHLSGIMKPTKGDIRVNGRLSALIEVGAGFHPDLTGRENIFLNGTILGMSRDEIKRKFDEIVEFSGLEEFIDTPVKRYSSGMYARLGFSVAAHVDPEILIVDEVLSVGDWAFQRKCAEKMNSVIRSGSAVIFVSHNLRAVSSLCSRGILLNHGRIVKMGAAAEVIQHYINEAMEDARVVHEDKDVYVSKVAIRDGNGQALQFEPGHRITVDISVSANTACNKLAVGINFNDRNHYEIFTTSTERLGYETFSLEAGQTRTITFELSLHLARGTYYLGAEVRRYDLNKTFDKKFPAATIFIDTDVDVRGVANLYPVVIGGDLKKVGPIE